MLNEEHSESAREEEENTKEPHREEMKTSGTTSTIEISTITPPIVSTELRNQSNLSYQSTGTSGSMYTQSGNLGRSMEDEMRLTTFRGDGSEDLDHHWFLCEAVWSIKNITDEAVKHAQFSTNLRDHTLIWYMKFVK